MIQNIIELSIRNRAVVVCGFVLVALLSVFSLKTARIDAIPDIGENQQIVFTECNSTNVWFSSERLML